MALSGRRILSVPRCFTAAFPHLYRPLHNLCMGFLCFWRVRIDNRLVFIGLPSPKRFYKENAISVTITVTRSGRCDINCGMNLKVRSQKAEGRRDRVNRGEHLRRSAEALLRVPLDAKHEKSWIIVEKRVISCLSRVSHRVIFRRNRALSCYIVSKIRNLFFGHSISALRALKGSCCSLPLLDGCAFVPQAS